MRGQRISLIIGPPSKRQAGKPHGGLWSQREGCSELGLVYDVIVAGIREGQGLRYHAALLERSGGARHKVSVGNGTHLLDGSVDDRQQVGERNESNNNARVTVVVHNRGRTQPGRAPQCAPVLPQ